MKVNFPLPDDNAFHQYCLNCHSEDIRRISEGEATYYLCNNCHTKEPRLFVIDPKVVWWVDDKTKEYWHESVGAFIFNQDDKALFFDRILFPFAHTIPAGHLDLGENVLKAVRREIKEETGVDVKSVRLKLFSEDDIVGDKCRRGSDCHKWHLFTTRIDGDTEIKLNDEGIKPVWLTLAQAMKKDLVYPVQYYINKYGDKLLT